MLNLSFDIRTLILEIKMFQNLYYKILFDNKLIFFYLSNYVAFKTLECSNGPALRFGPKLTYVTSSIHQIKIRRIQFNNIICIYVICLLIANIFCGVIRFFFQLTCKFQP